MCLSKTWTWNFRYSTLKNNTYQTENYFDFIIKYLYQIHNFYLYPISSVCCLLITKRHILYKNKLKLNLTVHYTEKIQKQSLGNSVFWSESGEANVYQSRKDFPCLIQSQRFRHLSILLIFATVKSAGQSATYGTNKGQQIHTCPSRTWGAQEALSACI